MGALRTIIVKFVGLFIDDGALALAALILIAVIAAGVKWAGHPALGGAVLLLMSGDPRGKVAPPYQEMIRGRV